MTPVKSKTSYPIYFTVLAAFLSLSLFACNDSSSVSSGSDDASPGSGSVSLIYPMYIDSNANDVNDYFEQATHDAGSSSRVTGLGSYGHDFVDDDNDGICDYAQNGSSTWHGPGFIDENGNGMSDYWDESSANYNMGGGMQYADQNGNQMNDYFEAQWHQADGHDFIDSDGDLICDYAQSGGASLWHGPGYLDEDGNGMYDNWQEGQMGNGNMYGGGQGSMM